jgi:hypothetical protein
MEKIEINGNVWIKFKGDEGQDVYVAKFMIKDNKDESMLGKFADQTSYDFVIESDTDFYLPANYDNDKNTNNVDKALLKEERVAFKFRKNVFTQQEQIGAFEGLFGAAQESHNRGMAAGPRNFSDHSRDWVTPYQKEVIRYYETRSNQLLGNELEDIRIKYENSVEENRGGVWLRAKLMEKFGSLETFFQTFMDKISKMSIDDSRKFAKEFKEEFISDTTYANSIWSGIAGFYGRYPRIPYGRPTSYTDHNREIFEKCYPFARKLDAEFKRLMPKRWERQNEYVKKVDSKFIIGEDTTFTTITVNTTTPTRNARMACHRDAGSLNDGFSNLTVVTKEGKDWTGGYLVAPEVRVAINVRPGDLLLIDNMKVIHGNTPIEPPQTGEKDFLRMSLVFYFREDMKKLKSWEYERTRREYVDDRRLNPSHPLWRKHWNGVSPNMWKEQEWYDYLSSKLGEEVLQKYHPGKKSSSKSSGLLGFLE